MNAGSAICISGRLPCVRRACWEVQTCQEEANEGNGCLAKKRPVKGVNVNLLPGYEEIQTISSRSYPPEILQQDLQSFAQ